MQTKNNIKNILLSRGFKEVVPTDEVLAWLQMTIKRFNKIISCKTEITLQEANVFANWLGVTIDELTSTPTTDTHNLADKFGLNQ